MGPLPKVHWILWETRKQLCMEVPQTVGCVRLTCVPSAFLPSSLLTNAAKTAHIWRLLKQMLEAHPERCHSASVKLGDLIAPLVSLWSQISPSEGLRENAIICFFSKGHGHLACCFGDVPGAVSPARRAAHIPAPSLLPLSPSCWWS